MVEEITLKDLKKGEVAVIKGFINDDIPSKFYEMGFLPGTELEVKQKAPFGGPICISLINNKSIMALRRQEADQILINKK